MKLCIFFLFVVLLVSCNYQVSKPKEVINSSLFNIANEIHKPKNSYQLALDSLILSCADSMLAMPGIKYHIKGRRLLGISRQYVKRLGYLGYAYQLTRESKYALKAEEYMLTVADYPSWNPSHYLDVAEMCMAMGIGLDWVRDALSSESINKIEDAIIYKGLRTSMDQPAGFLTNTNNWNQVCNGGLSIAAIAVRNNVPELSDSIIQRAKRYLTIPEKMYFPDGVYPEGPQYWEYGTAYHVLFIEAYKKLYPDSTILVSQPFLKSKDYLRQVIGPTGVFNYFDNINEIEVSAPFIWMSAFTNDYSTFDLQRQLLIKLAEGNESLPATGQIQRFLPLSLLFLKSEMFAKSKTPPLNWVGHGHNPVSIHRTGWGKNDIFLAIKGGSPKISHSHMDIGSFVLDAKGKRWVADLGRHDYHSLEKQGLKIWDVGADSDRWKVFRLTNHSHSTLVVDDQLQVLNGMGSIIQVDTLKGRQFTMLDISELYHPMLKQAIRSVELDDINKKVRVVDVLVNNETELPVRWAFPSKSKIELLDSQTAKLIQNEESIKVNLLSPSNCTFTIFNAQPNNDFEDQNPGYSMLGFTVPLKSFQKVELVVEFDLK